MGSNFINGTVTVLLAVIGVAILAVLVKNGSNTSSVISAASKGFSSILSTAEGGGTSGGAFGSGGILGAS
jgi:hypothetical protein